MDILDNGYVSTVVKNFILQDSKVNTPILNTFFGKKEYVDNGVVAVPKEVNSVDDLLPLINPRAGISASSVDINREYNYYALKYFGDLKMVTPQDIENFKRELQNLEPSNYNAKKIEIIKRITQREVNKVNTTREFMAGNAILGSIKDKDGNTIYSFDIPAENKLGDFKVSDDTKKPYEVLYALEKQSKKATKYRGRFALIIGASAYEKMMKSPSYQKLMELGQKTMQDSIDGVDGYFGGKYPFILADEEFNDKSGAKKSFFNEDSLLLAPTQIFAEYYQGIVTNDGSFANLFHIDTFKSNNPDGTNIRIQTGSMPIPTLPNGIVTSTLS